MVTKPPKVLAEKSTTTSHPTPSKKFWLKKCASFGWERLSAKYIIMPYPRFSTGTAEMNSLQSELPLQGAEHLQSFEVNINGSRNCWPPLNSRLTEKALYLLTHQYFILFTYIFDSQNTTSRYVTINNFNKATDAKWHKYQKCILLEQYLIYISLHTVLLWTNTLWG